MISSRPDFSIDIFIKTELKLPSAGSAPRMDRILMRWNGMENRQIVAVAVAVAVAKIGSRRHWF